MADAQGHYIEVNRQGCEMLGYSRGTAKSLHTGFDRPEDLANQPVRLAELRTGQSLLTERRLRCKDGRLLPVEIRGQMMADGKMLASVRDITERRRWRKPGARASKNFAAFVEQSSEILPGRGTRLGY
ncbi:MAG: PAS domain S-box protein [Anaerolineales bacterium]|nr:PAS domain S-box protein [Anaerolineales bacterium]